MPPLPPRPRARVFPHPRTRPPEPAEKSAARATIELCKRNHSVYEIAEALKEQGTPLSATAVGEVFRELGFAALPRRLDEERPEPPRPTVESVARLERQVSLSGWMRQAVSSPWRTAASLWRTRIASSNGSNSARNLGTRSARVPTESGSPWFDI
ncbi:MAG: hypothetical protein OXC08_06505 [Thiotrichales bacterium]|nr:hypothetical protein [Thiotrichales bacterium]